MALITVTADDGNDKCNHVVMPSVCSTAGSASAAAETRVLLAATPSNMRHSPPGMDRSVHHHIAVTVFRCNCGFPAKTKSTSQIQ